MQQKMKNDINFALKQYDTLLIKGFAICLMLWHHLFLYHPEFGKMSQHVALLGKVCVAMFLFVSAYGLTVQVEKKGIFTNIHKKMWKELLEFYIKRLSKLYASFWVVFIIFVPIGIFVFNRGLEQPYGSQVNLTKRLIFDFFGMQGFQSYNVIWWFYQLIIVLYLLFPFIYMSVRKWNLYLLPFFFLLLGFHKIHIPIIQSWLFQFAIGISCALNQGAINNFFNRYSRLLILFFDIVFMIIIAYMRDNLNRFGGTAMDGFFTLTWVLFIVLTVRKIKGLNSILKFLGKHSMNIFMIHGFIYGYFFSNFIYSFKYPFLIFLVLLMISLSISVTLEFVKTKFGIYVLVNKIQCIKIDNIKFLPTFFL